MRSKKVYCCHLLSARILLPSFEYTARYVHSFQFKHLLEIFTFLSNNCQKMGNMKIGTEIVNPDIHRKTSVPESLFYSLRAAVLL